MMCIPLYSTQRIHSAKITIVSNEVQQAKYMFGGQYYYINARAFILDSSLSGQIKICYSGDRKNSWTCARNHPETSDVFLVKKTFFSQDYGIYSRFMFQEGIFDKTVIWVIALGGFSLILGTILLIFYACDCLGSSKKTVLPQRESSDFYLELNGIVNFPISEKYYSIFSETTTDSQELIEEFYEEKYPFKFISSLVIVLLTYIGKFAVQFSLLVILKMDMSIWGYFIILTTSLILVFVSAFEIFPPYYIKYYILTDKSISVVIDNFYDLSMERYFFNEILKVEVDTGNSYVVNTIEPHSRILVLNPDPSKSKLISKLSSLLNLNNQAVNVDQNTVPNETKEDENTNLLSNEN